MYSDELSDVLRTELQPALRFRQLCDVRDATEKGLHAGAQFYWNVYSDVATQGGSIAEDDVMPETNFTVAQRSLTVTEYGNSVPFNQKLDNLSKHPVTEVIHRVLKNDAAKALDTAAHAQFDACKLRVAPTSGTSTTAVTLTTNGATATTNNVALGSGHVKAIVDVMKERNIPPFRNSDYVAVGWPSTFRTLKNDLESLHQYVDTGFQMITNGEIGRYEGCRFIEQTNVAKASWTNAKSDWAFFLGDDTVAEAVVIPEEIRGRIPTDFGRSRAVAWYALLGYGIAHDVAADSRIVKWDSAA